MSDEKDKKPEELKKADKPLEPAKRKGVVIQLTPDDHLENTPAHLRGLPRGDEDPG
jgi:hypothetical protein